MENYLVLHIDEEFIVGAIGADYGTPHYIRLDDGSSLMWLYFYNDPNLHKIMFGKGYKKPFMDRKPNYIGKFLQGIESTTNTFVLRYTHYPFTELLEESGMMALWRERYCTHTQSNPDSIPTLLSFSASISDLSKQNFVEYLREHGFDIHSYTIPLAELALKRLLRQNNLKVTAGSTALFLEATNATLHLTKLTYSDGYFLKDGTTKSIAGMGIDPRKRALCRYLVEELNFYTGFLSSNDEKEQEIDRFELDAAEWLRCLDMKPNGRPLNITVSFSRAQDAKRDIPVEKSNIEADTGRYMQQLVSEYKAFLHENAITTVDFCCFVGNCFLSDRIKGKFEDLIGKENTMFFSTNNLSEIISEYPRIDLKRYADEENRIRERALADELKQRQQREAELAKQAEEEAKRKAEKEKEEQLRKQREAEAAFNRANEFDSQGKLQEAKVAIDEAVRLSPANIDYKRVADYLDEKLKKKKEKVLLYMQYLDKGDALFANGEYEKAKAEYEKARNVDETAAISAKIIDCESSIKTKIEKEKKISNLLKEGDKLFNSGDFPGAISKYEQAYNIDNSTSECKAKIKECKKALEKIEKNKALVADLTNQFSKAEKEANFKQMQSLLKKIEAIDSTVAKEWEERTEKVQHDFEIKQQEIKKIEELHRKINSAVFDEDWGLVVSLCTEYLNIRPDNKIKDILLRGEKAIEEQEKDKSFQEGLSSVKALIADKKWLDAEKRLNDLQKKHPDKDSQLKPLRKIIFQAEDTSGEKSPQRKAKARVSSTSQKTKETTIPDFFKNDTPRKKKENSDTSKGMKNGKSSVKTTGDIFFDS